MRHEQNIGTVLFEKSDAVKHCWTTEEFVVLNSRRMFQELLPKVILPYLILNFVLLQFFYRTINLFT